MIIIIDGSGATADKHERDNYTVCLGSSIVTIRLMMACVDWSVDRHTRG